MGIRYCAIWYSTVLLQFSQVKTITMNTTLTKLFNPPVSAPKATILIRLMMGTVFFWEGILKFVYPNQGVGRFTKLGIPMPDVMATVIGVLEIVGGLCIVFGYLTRVFS